MSYQFIKFEIFEGVQCALLFDEHTGETIASPIRLVASGEVKKYPSVTAPHSEPAHEELTKSSRIPAAFREEKELEESAEVALARGKNPHATSNPQYAWQDPDWVSPEERAERMKHSATVPPIFGRDIVKIFNDPGKVEESKTFII